MSQNLSSAAVAIGALRTISNFATFSKIKFLIIYIGRKMFDIIDIKMFDIKCYHDVSVFPIQFIF